MPSYCNWLAGLRHPAGFSLLKEITYDKLSKVVLLDVFLLSLFTTAKTVAAVTFSAFKM